MVTLFCAIVGAEGSAFSIDIDTNKSVDHLKKAIKAENARTITCDAKDLQLFLAKKDDVWLDGAGAAAVALDEHGHPQGFVQMDPLLWIKNVKYFGDNFQPGEGEIHVLVVVPKHLVADPRLLELQESLLQHTLIDAPTSTSTRSNYFKASLIETYQCDMGDKMLRCMLLNTALPSELVIASHLFRRKNEFLSHKLMGFADIDDVKNGLLLFKPLEHAFDRFQISFIYDKDSNEFRLKVFDQSLRRKRLFEKLDDNQCKILLKDQTLPKYWKKGDPWFAPGTGFDLRTTFGDVEGQSLCFMSVERPYKRCLNLQARLARKKAIKEAWIQPNEDEFEDFWSEGMSLAEKMAFFSAREN